MRAYRGEAALWQAVKCAFLHSTADLRSRAGELCAFIIQADGFGLRRFVLHTGKFMKAAQLRVGCNAANRAHLLGNRGGWRPSTLV